MPELRVGYVRVCILFLLHAFEAMHRHLITLQSSSLRCGVSVQAKISSKSVTWMARHALTARTAGSSSKTDTSQTFRACLAHGHLLTSRRDTSMISRVLSKSFAVSKKKKKKRRRHWQQTCRFQGASRIQMHGWPRRLRSFEEQYIFGFK